MLLKKLLIFQFIFFINLSLIAQNTDFIPITVSTNDSLLNHKTNITPYSLLKNKKLNYSVTFGTSVTSINKNTALNYYVSPNFNYLINDKLKLNFGSSFMNGSLNYYPIYNNEILQTLPTNITQYTIYAQSQYQLNSKIQITSSVVYSINRFNNNKVNSKAFDFNNKEMTVGINYFINDKFHIGAQIGVTNRPYNIYNFNNFNYFNQYNNNPFMSNFTQ